MKKGNEVVIVTFIAALFALIVSLLVFLDGEFVKSELVGRILFVIWAFCAPPSYVISFRLWKNLTHRQAFQAGVLLGSLFFLFPLLLAPAGAVWYYIDAYKGRLG